MIICQPCHDQIASDAAAAAATRQQEKIINIYQHNVWVLLSGFFMISMLFFFFIFAQPCKQRGMNSLLQVLYHEQNTIIFIVNNLNLKVTVLPDSRNVK